jgi:two-component system chemotaxis response regulator CheY
VSKILIVDDSPTLRRMLKKELLSLGHEVVEAPDGPTALAQLGEAPVQLVTSDVNMAPMDGFTLVGKIREGHPREQLPILFFTTEASDQMKVRGRAAGANGWLTKPLVAARLTLALEHLLARA